MVKDQLPRQGFGSLRVCANVVAYISFDDIQEIKGWTEEKPNFKGIYVAALVAVHLMRTNMS